MDNRAATIRRMLPRATSFEPTPRLHPVALGGHGTANGTSARGRSCLAARRARLM